MHYLPLAYVGYGVLGGMGWGFGYTSPVSNMLKWFPDRRGLATGLGLTAFGGGAMVATPLMDMLTAAHFVAPEYLGSALDGSVSLVTDAGRQFAMAGGGAEGGLREVVVATADDVASLPGGLPEGVYVVGTGDTGAAAAMRSLSAGYLALMSAGALLQRVPWAGYRPAGFVEGREDVEGGAAAGGAAAAGPGGAAASGGGSLDGGGGSGHHHPGLTRSGALRLDSRYAVDADAVLRTPQFYLLWCAVVGNAMAGMAVLSSAKTIMGEVFAGAYPALVTGAFTTAFVAALSGANATGRLGWAVGSDWLGRQNTYYIFGLAAPFCLAVPYLTGSLGTADAMAGSLPLYAFIGGSCFVVSCYGGIFSVLPAYLADVFGERNVGAIHGKILTAWAAAAVLGPNVLASLRQSSYDASVVELAARVDPAAFREAFGAGVESLGQLVDAKTVSIARLMEIAPAGTVDPTPMIYDSTMHTMSGVLALAVVFNMAMRPVDPKHYTTTPDTDAAAAAAAAAVVVVDTTLVKDKGAQSR